MRKSNKIQVRKIEPDATYGNMWISKLINKMMQHGKKTIAIKIVNTAMEKALKETNVEINDFINKIIKNVSPKSGTTKRKLGGTIYNVPVELDQRRSEQMGIGFIAVAARARLKTSRSTDGKVLAIKKNRTISDSLCQVLINAYNGVASDAIVKLNELSKLAEANAAFSHLASPSKTKSKKPSVKSLRENKSTKSDTGNIEEAIESITKLTEELKEETEDE